MYDTIVIGGGIAGLTSALYLARAGMKVLLFEENFLGGQIINACEIENYPGILNISGYDLISNLKSQVDEYENVEIKYEKVISISENNVKTEKSIYNTKTIIIASGLKRKTLNIENEDELIGAGLSYCATCDGAFFKGKDVALIGGGNSALDECIYLSKIVNKVYIILRRDEFRGDQVLVDKVKKLNNVEIIYNSNVTKLIGNPLNSIEINNNKLINVSGIFITIGSLPNTNFLDGLITTDSDGYIISEDTKTNIENIFVAGDVRSKDVRQLITASSDGIIAAKNAIYYINN